MREGDEEDNQLWPGKQLCASFANPSSSCCALLAMLWPCPTQPQVMHIMAPTTSLVAPFGCLLESAVGTRKKYLLNYKTYKKRVGEREREGESEGESERNTQLRQMKAITNANCESNSCQAGHQCHLLHYFSLPPPLYPSFSPPPTLSYFLSLGQQAYVYVALLIVKNVFTTWLKSAARQQCNPPPPFATPLLLPPFDATH